MVRFSPLKLKAVIISFLWLYLSAYQSPVCGVPGEADTLWVPVRFEVSPAVGEMNWSVLWRIYVYQEPDRFCGDLGVFVNRHVNPYTRFELPAPVTRQSKGMDEQACGAQVSNAALPGGEIYDPADGKSAHQRDWDFIVAETQRILAEKGLAGSSDRAAQIRAMAEYVQSRRGGKVYESRGPADFLLHSSYCTGAANALAAIASTMDLDYRTINHYGHSVTEVLVDGKWYFIENSVGYPVFVTSTLMRLTCEAEAYPYDKEKYGKRYPEWNLSGDDWMRYGAVYSLSSRWWHFNQGSLGADRIIRSQSLRNGCGVCVGLDGNTAGPLYPGLDEYLFKAVESGAMLVAGKYCWYYTTLPLGPGQRVRRSFYLGGLRDPGHPVTAVVAQLILHPGGAKNFPPDGKGWYLLVNGRRFALESPEVEWSVERKRIPVPGGYLPNPAGLVDLPEEYLAFRLPIDALKQESINIVELAMEAEEPAQGKKRAGLLVRLFPDPVAPYLAPVSAGAGQELPASWTVNPDHICEVLRVVGWEFGGTPSVSSSRPGSEKNKEKPLY